MNEWQALLDEMTADGELLERLEDGRLRCTACAHRCTLAEGRRGICQVRFHRQGRLRVPYGYVAALHVDPIEKKPFNHLLPGRTALTFGMLGCDFHCDFCQNWQISQEYCDPLNGVPPALLQRTSPQELVRTAVRAGAAALISSYNEPLITSEWAAAVFREAKAAGLRTAYVSNGHATPEVLAYLRPHLDAYKIDLKSMQERRYREMGGKLQAVLDSIAQAHGMGLWVEVVTLVIPGFNDSPEELWEAARTLRALSADVPWHVTAFHPDYHHTQAEPTSAALLQQAAEIGQEAGLRYVYAGNRPGRVGSLENTYCPQCALPLVQRRGFSVLENVLTPQGKCPRCGAAIAGIWS